MNRPFVFHSNIVRNQPQYVIKYFFSRGKGYINGILINTDIINWYFKFVIRINPDAKLLFLCLPFRRHHTHSFYCSRGELKLAEQYTLIGRAYWSLEVARLNHQLDYYVACAWSEWVGTSCSLGL